jgi:hypothetical protein
VEIQTKPIVQENKTMIEDFDEFCLYVYCIVDEICQKWAHYLQRPGPEPVCSDSELIAMVLISECKGWDVETELLSHWQAHRDLFPHLPGQSRFNRRRRNLMGMTNEIRRVLLSELDIAQDRQCVIDSLPIEVVQFHLVPGCGSDWQVHQATFGWIASKKKTIFGYKLHLLITLSGLIIDFVLAPAHVPDLEAGLDLLFCHVDLAVWGDKAYISAAWVAQLWLAQHLCLQTLPRRNQKKQLPPAVARLFNSARQIIETVNGQLTEQFQIETNHAHTFWGLCARLFSKLTAHTLCIYINRLLGKANFLQIKSLAFPI